MPTLSDAQIDALLAQDAPYGDLTTATLEIGQRLGRITFAARDAMVLCATEEAARLVERAGGHVLDARPSGGAEVAAGTVFLTAEGSAGALHRAWKVAQTLVEYASGIATRTRHIVEAARAGAPPGTPGVAIACTRKNFPGTKEISVKAVLAGGAAMHRLGLSETLLVFPEHRVFLEVEPVVWLARLRARAPERKTVVETASVAEAIALAEAGADVVQLEKLPPADVAQVVAATRDRRPPPVIAVAGGVNVANAAAYAATGCGLLVTSAPFFGPPRDVQVTITSL